MYTTVEMCRKALTVQQLSGTTFKVPSHSIPLLPLLLFYLVGVIDFQRLCKLDIVELSLFIRKGTLEEPIQLNIRET